MSDYIVFLLAFAASAAAPGPEIAALLSRSLSGGMLRSLPLAIGIILGKLLMLTAAVIGVSALLQVIGPAFVVLKIAGGAYLTWLGIRKWRNAGCVLDSSKRVRSGQFVFEVGLGLTMTLSNPLAIAFYIALLPGMMDVSGITLSRYGVLCILLVSAMAVIVLCYGTLAEVARRLFVSPQAKTNIDRASGAMMIGAGVVVATR